MAFKRSGVRFPSPPLGRRRGLRRGQHARNAACEEYRHEHTALEKCAGIAQLVEHNLAKVGVAGSSPVSRSSFAPFWID